MGCPLSGSHPPARSPLLPQGAGLFRLANPKCELRIAAGRENPPGHIAAAGAHAASSIFVGDYLTTPGGPGDDYRMIEELGFEPVPNGT